jgi:hypothetical protein
VNISFVFGTICGEPTARVQILKKLAETSTLAELATGLPHSLVRIFCSNYKQCIYKPMAG